METADRPRLDTAMAWIRLWVTLVSGLSVLPPAVLGSELIVLWIAAIAYALLVILLRPHRFCSARVWWALTGFIDWTLISVAIVLSGGLHSDFYVLYFVLVFGSSVRFGLREAVLCGLGTSLFYLGLMLIVAIDVAAVLPVVALRMGYLMTMAVGCGLLARAADRETRADVSHEAEQSAVRDIAATLSRELSNPLSAASALIDILLDPATGSLSPQQRALVCGLDGSIENAGGLARNVVASERLERGQHGFSPGFADLNSTVHDVVNSFARLAEAKAVGLVLNLTPALPLVRFDARWLQQALGNVLRNAVQFAPRKGALRVSTLCSRGWVSIEVWDSGAAIPSDLEPNLFAKFVRDHGSRGIGLGLYVAKRIVELHGGTIAAGNAADGVVVTLSLPCPAQQPSLVALPGDASWTLRGDPLPAS